MLNPTILLLGLFSVTVLARPYPTEPTAVIEDQSMLHGLSKRREGVCKTEHLADRAWFDLGVEAACRYWFYPAGVQNPDPYRTISVKGGLSAYSDLPAYDDGTNIRYHFDIKIESDMDGRVHKTLITEEQCRGNLKSIVEKGKLGKEYCEVDGTGVALARGGRVELGLNPSPKLAKMVYQVRT